MSKNENISLRKKIKKLPGVYEAYLKINNFMIKPKEFYRSLRFGFLAKYFPKRHCRLMTKPGGRKETPFKINLNNPIYFNEKLLWLKYYVYNKSPLVAKCYDKYLVREYVKECGCENILNDLYGVWDSIDEINWDSLPDEYVLKITNGNSYHIFKTKEQDADIDRYKHTLRVPAKKRNIIYRSSGDLFALKCPQRIISEKLLKNSANHKALDDWKFYCFNGEPKYLLYVYDRVLADGSQNAGQEKVFMTVDFKNMMDYYKDSNSNLPEKPACYNEMLECARKLSKDFPFVRVDFYISEDKPVFGELTFTPAGGYLKNLLHNKEGLAEMGDCLFLDNINEYTKLKKSYNGL